MMSILGSVLGKLGEIVPRIQSVYAFAAFSLLIFCISLLFLPGVPDGSKPWLLTALLSATIIVVALLLIILPHSDSSVAEFVGLRALIQSSNLPMYLTDTNLNVVCCNHQFAELLNCEKSALDGKHLLKMVDYFAQRVPRPRRAKFVSDQKALINKSMSEYSPHAERVEYIDNRDLPGNNYNFLMRVRIHADKVRATTTGKELGIFVIYYLEKVDELPNGASAR
jgi:hypothetical protein